MKDAQRPLFAVLAKTAAGKAFFASHWQQVLPDTFPCADSQWFRVDSEGLALHAPGLDRPTAEPGCSALSFAGTVYGENGPLAPPDVGDFLREGSRIFERLSGEFVAAFWHGDQRQLTLARDPMGQQDLFVREDPHFYVVCSSIEPLLADPDFDCQLDVESAVHYLMFGVPRPGRTLARAVTRLPAGHCFVWNTRGPLLRHRHFTPLGFDARKVPSNEDRQQIANALDRAIYARIAQGRQAILLSGGVDSSYVAVTAARHSGGDCFDAYTVRFAEPYPHNEGEYAGIVARASGIRHHEVDFTPAQACDALDAVLAAPLPCSAWACMTHHHLLSHIGADGHRHLLSGLGADEVFGGYWNYFRAYARLRLHEEAWAHMERIDAFDGLLWSPAAARKHLFAGIPRFFPDSALRAAFPEPYRQWSHTPELIEFYRECRRLKPTAHLFESMVAHECQHRIPDLLFAGFETQGRARGVRSAYPFLSSEVATKACALGASERFWLKGRRWQNKKVLREIAAERVPAPIMRRPLFSYTAPILLWLRELRFADAIKARLRDAELWKSGLIDRAWLHRVEHEVFHGNPSPRSAKFSYVDQLWALVTLAAWHERWVTRSA